MILLKNHSASKYLQGLASLKITVACLMLLAVLTFWGTIDQVENGLYLAQEKFFNSYFVYIGFLPIPSARLTVWLLFFNLLASLLVRFDFSFKKLGLIISHLGMLTLLISGFLTLNFSHESFLTLLEGESGNRASDYMKWELVLKSKQKELIIPEAKLKQGFIIETAGHSLEVKNFYINAQIFETPFAGKILKELELSKDYENNSRAIRLVDKASQEIIEMDGFDHYYKELSGQDRLILVLRKKEYKLPFAIELIDVERELHTGTEKAKEYSSKVLLKEKGLKRELKISMNKPLRSGLYTVYQSSYGISEDGQEISSFAVVKNLNYTLPYIGSLLASLGLFIHFISGFLKLRSLKSA